MNRGVEIDARVADSDASLSSTRCAPGLIVRMAVLYDLLTTRPGRGRDGSGGRVMLVGRTGADDVVIRGARVLDPVEGVDATLDVRIDNGVIAQIGADLDANGHRVVDAAGLVLAPAFIDPHVHLRTPGREDEETISTRYGGRGRRRLLRDPRDSEHGARRRRRGRPARPARASRDGGPRAGRLPRRDHEGPGRRRADRDGRARRRRRGRLHRRRTPGRRCGVMRRALQYNAITGRMIAVHCEEQTLTRGGHAHAGAVAAELGLGGWPSLGESLMVARDIDLAGERGRRCT